MVEPHGVNHVPAMPRLLYVTVVINGVDRAAALGGGVQFTADQTELVIEQWITCGNGTAQWNTIDLTPANLGRIVGHVSVVGYIQSD